MEGKICMKRDICGCLITLLIGIVFGIIVGYNAYITLIPGIVTAIWIAFGIGVGALVLLTLIAAKTCCKKEKCICRNGKCIAIAAVGTIITSIIGLSITITAESVLIAILIGLGTLFLTMTILGLLNLVLCLVDENCECR